MPNLKLSGRIIKIIQTNNPSVPNRGIILTGDKLKYTFFESSVKLGFSFNDFTVGDDVFFNLSNNQKYAKNVEVVSIIPTFNFQNIEYYGPFIGETLVVKSINDKIFVGEFINYQNDSLTLKFIDDLSGPLIKLNRDDIKNIYYCGLLTSFNSYTNVGTINSSLKFKLKSINSKLIESRLLQLSFTQFIVLYSTAYEDGKPYILDIIDFEFGMDKLKWQKGIVKGFYKPGSFFTVDLKYRCYLSQIYDETMSYHVKNSDYLFQQVFYRFINHKSFDSNLPERLGQSIVDIRSVIQSGIYTKSEGNEYFNFSNGPFVYKSYLPLELNKLMKPVVFELKCENFSLPEVVRILEDSSLPTFKDKNMLRKQKNDQLIKDAYQKKDYEQLIILNVERIENYDVDFNTAFPLLLNYCVRIGKYEPIINMLLNFGHLLKQEIYYSINMQVAFLENRIEEAITYADKYLSLKSPHKQLFEIAISIKKKTENSEQFRKSLIDYSNKITDLAFIEQFIEETGEGIINNNGQKYLFSKDNVLNYKAGLIDLRTKNYFVSFEIDFDNDSNNAVNIKIHKFTYKKNQERNNENDDEEEDLINQDFDNLSIQENNITDLEFPLQWIKKLDFKELFPINEFKKSFKLNVKELSEYDVLQLVQSLVNYKKTKRPVDQRKSTNDIPYYKLYLGAAKLIYDYIDASKLYAQFFQPNNKESINITRFLSHIYNAARHYLLFQKQLTDSEKVNYINLTFKLRLDTNYEYFLIYRSIAVFFQINIENIKFITFSSFDSEEYILKVLKSIPSDLENFVKFLMNVSENIFAILIKLIEKANNSFLIQAIKQSLRFPSDDLRVPVLQIQTAYQAFQQDKERLKKSISDFEKKNLRNDAEAQSILKLLEEIESNLGGFLFEEDLNNIILLKGIFSSLLNAGIKNGSSSRNIEYKANNYKDVFLQLKRLIDNIYESYSELSFSSFLGLIEKLKDTIVDQLNIICKQYQPKVTANHHSINRDLNSETISLDNDENSLPAYNPRIKAYPFENKNDFVVDDKDNRSIQYDTQTLYLSSDRPMEIRIPLILKNPNLKQIDIEIEIYYECWVRFDPITGDFIRKPFTEKKQYIQIPLVKSKNTLITTNKYRDYAGGLAMDPKKSNAKEMFFGREKEIKEVLNLLLDNSGKVKEGNIVAIYGQKRSGKTSIMNFIGEKIKNLIPDAIILSLSIQGISTSEQKNLTFFNQILGLIVSEFRTELLKKERKDLLLELSDIDLAPIKEDEFMRSSDSTLIFNSYFKRFRNYYGSKYPIVILLDEFSKIYIPLIKHQIDSDFLNLYRAMIQSNNFANLIVGHDVMQKFFYDNQIAALNSGLGFNGLGTVGKIRITYLDYVEARKMITEPLRFPDGTDRYRGKLGEAAIQRIYQLTGGSAFYLMKFMNCLANYMIENEEQLISLGLVNKVSTSYVFETNDSPINKVDFDPLFNEFGLSKNNEQGSNDSLNDNEVLKLVETNLKMFYEIAKASDSQGDANYDNVNWNEPIEKREIIKSFIDRGILVDSNNRDIHSNEIEHLSFRIKVDLFNIFLNRGG